jgi:hypothetical protein
LGITIKHTNPKKEERNYHIIVKHTRSTNALSYIYTDKEAVKQNASVAFLTTQKAVARSLPLQSKKGEKKDSSFKHLNEENTEQSTQSLHTCASHMARGNSVLGNHLQRKIRHIASIT